MKEIVDRAMDDMNARPDPWLRGVMLEEGLRDVLLIEDCSLAIGLVRRGDHPPIALNAIEFDPDPRSAPIGREDPWTIGKRWIVPCVAPVSAREPRDPLRIGILMKRDDPAVHRLLRHGRVTDRGSAAGRP